MSTSWAVVGGGMLGLTLAARLAGQGKRVTLFEAAPEVGGLTASWRLRDVAWDRFYHVVLASDAHTRKVLGELGLDAQVRWVTTRTGVLAGGRMHSISSSLDLARFPVLGLADKARLAATVVQASRRTDWRALERVSVEEWLVRWGGRAVWERWWLPLLRSKLGEAWRETSATFMWATIQRLYAARRSGLKRELFGYVPGGYAQVLQAFGRALVDAGVEVRTGAAVKAVERADGGLRVVLADGSSTFDRVVVTAPPPLAAGLCPGLSAYELDRLRAVRYLGVACASVLLKRPLAGCYVTNLLDPAPFTGVIEMTALVDPAELGGRHLVYLPRYLGSDDPFLDQPDEAVRAAFVPALQRCFPSLADADVLAFQVARARHVMALPVLGYSRTVPRVRTSVPGLYLVSSARIVNGTTNVNETVALAERAALAFRDERFGDELPALA
jgi:protoporphyrinogen oxidase